jgi:hypothetical protein
VFGQISIEVLPVSKITSIVGIWCSEKWVYILRKHPGLSLLNVEESEKSDEDEMKKKMKMKMKMKIK